MLSKLQQSDKRYTRLAFVALLLSQIVYFGCHGKPASNSGQGSDTGRRVVSLTPNQTTANQLTSGETHAYTISLPPHQYLRLVVHPSKAPLIVRLIEPGGQTLAQHTARCYGILPLSFI